MFANEIRARFVLDLYLLSNDKQLDLCFTCYSDQMINDLSLFWS